jgi:hypothetical protein
MQRHASILFAQKPLPVPPADPAGLQFLDFNYYWDFFLSLPLDYKIGLFCLAALLYHAIRRQYRGP